jgi:hypothetical protein
MAGDAIDYILKNSKFLSWMFENGDTIQLALMLFGGLFVWAVFLWESHYV